MAPAYCGDRSFDSVSLRHKLPETASFFPARLLFWVTFFRSGLTNLPNPSGAHRSRLRRRRSNIHDNAPVVLCPERCKAREIQQHRRPSGEEAAICAAVVSIEARGQAPVRGLGHLAQRCCEDRIAAQVRSGFRARIPGRGIQGRDERAFPRSRCGREGARSRHTADEHAVLTLGGQHSEGRGPTSLAQNRSPSCRARNIVCIMCH